MKYTYIKPLAIALLLGVLPLTISSAQAVSPLRGAKGPVGDKGATGLPGAKGPAGDKGATGLPGAAGGKGAAGDKGATGLPGAAGGKGAAGDKGATGLPGADGASTPGHAIGDPYQGGVIFYLEPELDHGLIAALTDQQNGNFDDVSGDPVKDHISYNARGDGYYAGAMNTANIIASQSWYNPGHNDYAALYAANYQVQADGSTPCEPMNHQEVAYVTCYGDWYLPSNVELMTLAKSNVARLGPFVYVSSTEYYTGENPVNSAVWVYAAGNYFNAYFGKSGNYHVRAIRRF